MSRNWIKQTLQVVVADLDEEVSDSITLVAAEDYKWRVEIIYRYLLAQELVGGLDNQEKEALDYVAQAYACIGHEVDRLAAFGNQALSASPAQASTVLSGAVGRPSFHISPTQLEFLINNRFSVPQIAQIIGVSISTIRRRMLTFNMSIRATYSTITDEELDSMVSRMQQQYPNWGNRQMYGYLLSQNLRVQFSRVRESQSRVDPNGSVLRSLFSLQRRSYSVCGPQHLWHIDGHHKLIRLASLSQHFTNGI